jgi:nicotinamidase-related amidase
MSGTVRGRRLANAALILVDFVNPMEFDGASRMARSAIEAGTAAAELKRRARRQRAPVIYANDNFGAWRADFAALVKRCRAGNRTSRSLMEVIAPEADDYSILKPMHSAFFGTPLEFLLDELKCRKLILAGLTTDICIMFTAHDAYMRKFDLWVPADCAAAERHADHVAALARLERVLKADVRPYR